MSRFQRHFTEEAFLFSTFVEFNKCWRSGKKSRLVIESVNGFAFVNFSAFLGHPKTVYEAPPEKNKPGRKSRKKSKKKTERDNERAARFQARKQQEKDAAASEASKNPLPTTSSPLTFQAEAASASKAIITSSPGAESAMTVSDLGFEFSFSSPVPENLRQDKSQGTSMILSNENDQKKQEDDSSDSEF